MSANSADTLQPYEPGKVIGSQDPVLPAPASGKGGCGGVGKIIMAVVAVAVAAVTQQWWLMNVSGITGGVGAAASQGAWGALFASGAAGAAAGSVASQLVGNAIGAQDGFSWKSVGLSALSGGVTAGLAGSGVMAGTDWGMTAARAATANALTQGIGVVTGLQKSFDWKGVAGAAVGAGVGAAMNNALGGYTLPEGVAGPQVPAAFSGLGSFAGGVVRGTLSSIAAGTAAAVARGGKVAIQQVAADAFGNALGGALLDYANAPTPSAATSMGRPASIGANGEPRFGVMGLEPDPISQAYDYSQRNPNSGIRFSDAVEYYGAKESAQYLPSLIPDSQLIGRGKTTEGLDYYDWDSGARATQTLLKSVQGVPLPAWEDTQVSALPSRESTRSYYQDIEDNASHAAMAATARVARLATEGFHDNVDSVKSLIHLAQDDKARRMALAQGLYAIANPGETVKSAASGAANYVRTLSFEKAGEDGLRFLSGAALSAGVGKGASMVGSLASDALVLDRVAGKVGDAAGKVANSVVADEIAALQRIGVNSSTNVASAERMARITELSESVSGRYLSRLQAEAQAVNPNAHFFDRHGFNTTLEQQYVRASTGLTPDNVQQSFLVDSSRFLTARDQVAAIQRASSINQLTGQSVVNVNMGSILGEGFTKLTPSGGGLDYLLTTNVRTVFKNGVVYTQFPTLR